MNVEYGRISLNAYKTLACMRSGKVYDYYFFDCNLLQELKYAGYVKIWSDLFGTHVCLRGKKNNMPLNRF